MAGSGRSADDPGQAEPPSATVEARTAAAASTDTPAWMWCGLAVVVGLCFAPALHCDFIVNWDDDHNLLNNPAYRGLSLAHLRWMFTTFHGGHYQPLSWITLALDYRLWGMWPPGYHLTNVILHAANVLLVYALARALLRWATRPQVPDPAVLASAAAVAALAFGIHPLRVESVAWVTERRDVLSSFFLLLAVLAYVRMVDAAAARRRWLLLSLGCFSLSLLSKAWGMTLPVVLLVLDAYPLRRGAAGAQALRRRVLEKIPFIALAAAAMVAAALAQLTVSEMRSLGQHGVTARLVQAAYGLMFYLWKTLLPLNLSPLYPLRPDFNPAAAAYVTCAVAAVTVTVSVLWARRRWPWALAAWTCYVVILSPVLGILQTGPQLVADRYTYLACLPWALLAGAAVCRFPTLRRPAGAAVVVTLLLAIGALTFRQTWIWTNAFTLWDHALGVDRTNYVANVDRGWLELQRGNVDGAIAYYDAALRANPQFALAYRSRAVARHQRGDLRGALADDTVALQLEPLAATYLNRGLARHALGDTEGALADYSAALRLNDTDPQPYNNRGMLRRERGDLRGAIGDFERALEVAPPGWPYRAQTENNLQETRALAARGG